MVLAGTFGATYSFHVCNIHPPSTAAEMFSHFFSAISQSMVNHTSSPISVLLLLACLVVLAAIQYPLWLQRTFSPRFSTLGPQSGFEAAHRHEMQKIKFGDGSSQQRARERVLKQLIKTKGWERDTSHPRRRVLAALVGFLEYREKMEEGVQRKRTAWAKLSVRQKEVCFVSFATTCR